MIDFKKLLPKEIQEHWQENHERVIAKKLEYANMSNDTLANTTEYFLTQMKEPRKWLIGDCVYDATFYHIILPELLRRIRKDINKE